MRTYNSLLLASVLAACSGGEAADETAVEPGDQKLACAIGSGAELTDSCTFQRVEHDGTVIYRVNHPGGGFRLFELAQDGSGLVPHDGADGAVNRLENDQLEVQVGEDRYLFPARLNAQ